MAGLGFPLIVFLLWSDEEQIPNTGNVNIALNNARVNDSFVITPAEKKRKKNALPPKEIFSTMIERPLFSPDRRKKMPMDSDRSPVSEEADQSKYSNFPYIEFIGTFADGNEFRALINDQQGVRSVAIGQKIEDWHVTMIESRRLKLERGAEQISLSILESES